MLYPGIRPPLRNSSEFHNLISQMVHLGKEGSPPVQHTSPPIIIPQENMSQPLNFPYATTSVARSQLQNPMPLVIAIPKGTTQPFAITYPLS